MIRSPTRYSHTNTCIDLIFTNCNCVGESGVIDVNISDHQPVSVTRKRQAKTNIQTRFTGRSYVNFDEDLFHERLLAQDWDHLYEVDDVAWEYFISNITRTIDVMCPLKSFRIKNLKDPWITNEILENIHDKVMIMIGS